MPVAKHEAAVAQLEQLAEVRGWVSAATAAVAAAVAVAAAAEPSVECASDVKFEQQPGVEYKLPSHLSCERIAADSRQLGVCCTGEMTRSVVESPLESGVDTQTGMRRIENRPSSHSGSAAVRHTCCWMSLHPAYCCH